MHCFLPILVAAMTLSAAEYKIKASPDTVIWGYYWAGVKPVLTVKSGDVVEMQTVSGIPQALERAGVPPDQVQPELSKIRSDPPKDRGPGPHLLTGPVAIEGAMPGDVLEVRIREIRMDVPYAANTPGIAGFLSDAFPIGTTKIIRLDRERLIGHFAPGVGVPLKPFFGSMGVAPPDGASKISSGPPGRHAGNLDNKELVEGTALFIPVFAQGALFEAGDGHAGQGDGEVNSTAMETSLTGVFQLILHKNVVFRRTSSFTPSASITFMK